MKTRETITTLLPAALSLVGIGAAYGNSPEAGITKGAGWTCVAAPAFPDQQDISTDYRGTAPTTAANEPDPAQDLESLDPASDERGSDQGATEESVNDDGEPVRRYITREEKLEAGERREITDWLYTTTLAEYEWNSERKSGRAATTETDRSSAVILQGGVELVLTDYFQAEMVLEYDSEADKTIVDELVAAARWEPLEIEVGKQDLPFGEYFSRFVTGPLIEFGETAETAVKLSYEFGDLADLSLTAYDGPATAVSGRGSDLDFVTAVETEPSDRLLLGFSHITDLADSDERLLRDDGDLFAQKVPAVSGYAFWIGDNYELSLEYVSALDRFRELDEEIDRPSAWNLELGLFVIDNLDLAVRLEGSDELEDAPQRQLGIAATLLLHEGTTLTFEILHGRFKDGFVRDDEDNAFDDFTTLGVLFSAAF